MGKSSLGSGDQILLLTCLHRFTVIKVVSQYDKATISAHIKHLADGVAYGGTLTTKFHDLGLRINVPSIEPSSTSQPKSEVKSCWNYRWPFTENSQNVWGGSYMLRACKPQWSID